MKKILLYTLVVLLVLGLVGACFGESETEGNNKTNGDSAAATNAAAQTESASSAWEYSETIDEMTDKKSYLAYVESENSVNFDFPYDGGSTLSLCLRDDPQYGKDVYIKISKGQFNSNVISGQTIKVRFDQDKPYDVRCNGSSDYSMDVLFLDGYKKLVERLKTAKTMKISVEFFNEGTRTFTFNVENLEWEH